MGILDDILGIKSKSPVPEGGQGKEGKAKGGLNWGGKNPYTKASSLKEVAKNLPSTTRPWQRPVNSSTSQERATGMYTDIFGKKGNLTQQDIDKVGKDLDKARIAAKLGSRPAEEKELERKIAFYKGVTGKDVKK